MISTKIYKIYKFKYYIERFLKVIIKNLQLLILYLYLFYIKNKIYSNPNSAFNTSKSFNGLVNNLISLEMWLSGTGLDAADQ